MLRRGILTILWCALVHAAYAEPAPQHGIAYYGELKYPPGFAHFDYVNPSAPKGGRLSQGIVGTFNNLHPYTEKGTAAWGINVSQMLTYDMLMRGSRDELWSSYGLLAESVRVADDFSWVEFTLDPRAHWHDGVPVTVDDMIFTYQRIKVDASLGWRTSYQHVIGIEQVGPRTVRFLISDEAPRTRQQAMFLTQFYTLPKHYWEGRKFDETTLEPPLGCGPYRITEIDPGHRIVYERVRDYWAKDLNVNVGHDNFDIIEYRYFLDKNVALEGLKAHVFDFYAEPDAKSWATAYDFPAREKGFFIHEERPLTRMIGMPWAILFNTRVPKLADVRVREALTLLYDFEWSNRVLYYNSLARGVSYFQGSNLSSEGTLPSPSELALLEPLRGKIPDRVFTDIYQLPVSTGFGRNSAAIERALALFSEAGYEIRDFKLVSKATGEPFTLSFLMRSAAEEQAVMPYVEALRHLGIDSRVRTVESSQYSYRRRFFDFEVAATSIGQAEIPYGYALRNSFASINRDRTSWNYAGIADPAVDYLVETLIAASTEEEMNTAGRALDRVLLWSFYMIPSGYTRGAWYAYWDRFDDPRISERSTGFYELWWVDPVKNARIAAGLERLTGPGS